MLQKYVAQFFWGTLLDLLLLFCQQEMSRSQKDVIGPVQNQNEVEKLLEQLLTSGVITTEQKAAVEVI